MKHSLVNVMQSLVINPHARPLAAPKSALKKKASPSKTPSKRVSISKGFKGSPSLATTASIGANVASSATPKAGVAAPAARYLERLYGWLPCCCRREKKA
jgi:hypothetical protein